MAILLSFYHTFQDNSKRVETYALVILHKIYIFQRCQMKSRAGRQTESKIPPNLSFHRQIHKNRGFQAEKWQKGV